MANSADIARSCSGLGDSTLEAQCRRSLEECESSWTSDPSRSSCTTLTLTCVEQKRAGRSTFELTMPIGGRLQLPSPEACFQTAVRITKTFWPEAYLKPPEPLPDSHRPPPPPPKPPDAGPKPPAPPPASAGHCKSVGDPGTPEFAKCQELVGICLAKDSGVYQLPLGNASVFAANQASCLRAAPHVARAQFNRPPVEEKSAAAGTTAGIAPFTPDGKTRFGIGFAQAGFRLRTTTDDTSEKILLIPLFRDARKFIPIGISYRVEASGGGRYRLTYTITSKGGTTIGGEETIELLAGDGLHLDENLGFGITLNSEGSFGSIASVKIVKLAE